MPNEIEESLVSRKVAVKKVYDQSSSGAVYQEQAFGNINGAKTSDNYKSVADDIGWLMANYGTTDQPSTAYQLDKFIINKVEQKGAEQ